jgi:TonB-dependent receptor
MEVSAALQMLLAGTDLVPVRVGRAIALKRRSSAPAVRTTAAAAPESYAQSPDPAQDSAEPAPDAAQEVVVTGIRASLQESIAAKRAADSIVDVISAQDIGKLPDQNVAEAMSRVTGVQISRREGDGSNFTIRGISQNRLEINGRNYIGPGNGGNAALESVSPEILSSIVVAKSPTADMPEGALGATVNLKTKRPLDLADLVVAGRIQGAHADQADHIGYRGSAMVSTRIGDRFGLLASVAYSDTKTRGYSFDAGGWTRTNAIDGNGDGIDDPGLFRPNRFMARIFDRAEQRLTVNGTAQWRPTDTLEIILDATFNHLKRQRNSVNYQVLFNNNDTAAVVNDQGTVVAGTFQGVTVRPLIYDEPTDLKSTLLGGSVKWEKDRARVRFDMSYAHGKGSDGGPGASFTYVVVPRAAGGGGSHVAGAAPRSAADGGPAAAAGGAGSFPRGRRGGLGRRGPVRPWQVDGARDHGGRDRRQADAVHQGDGDRCSDGEPERSGRIQAPGGPGRFRRWHSRSRGHGSERSRPAGHHRRAERVPALAHGDAGCVAPQRAARRGGMQAGHHLPSRGVDGPALACTEGCLPRAGR